MANVKTLTGKFVCHIVVVLLCTMICTGQAKPLDGINQEMVGAWWGGRDFGARAVFLEKDGIGNWRIPGLGMPIPFTWKDVGRDIAFYRTCMLGEEIDRGYIILKHEEGKVLLEMIRDDFRGDWEKEEKIVCPNHDSRTERDVIREELRKKIGTPAAVCDERLLKPTRVTFENTTALERFLQEAIERGERFKINPDGLPLVYAWEYDYVREREVEVVCNEATSKPRRPYGAHVVIGWEKYCWGKPDPWKKNLFSKEGHRAADVHELWDTFKSERKGIPFKKPLPEQTLAPAFTNAVLTSLKGRVKTAKPGVSYFDNVHTSLIFQNIVCELQENERKAFVEVMMKTVVPTLRFPVTVERYLPVEDEATLMTLE